METYHHLSPHSKQFISILHEFAEKELKNKDDAIHNFKIFQINYQLKALDEAVAALNFDSNGQKIIAMANIIKTLEWKDEDRLYEIILAKMDLDKSTLPEAFEAVTNESNAHHSLVHDIFYAIYGKKSFFKYADHLRSYLRTIQGEEYDDGQWLDYLGDLLRDHHYISTYGREKFMSGLESNLLSVGKMKKKLEKKKDTWLERELKVDEKGLKELKKKYAKMVDRPERGIETLFRLTSKNHYTLNAMVDRKSNILISINAIILSIILGTLLGKIDDDPHLIAPIIMILGTNLTSIVFAIFATRPDKTHGSNGERGFHHLLFYGNFKDMKEKSYVEGLNQLMGSAEMLYNSIGSDIYYLGLNLDKKFNFLRKSFNVFMYGIILSVVTFVVCHIFFAEVVT